MKKFILAAAFLSIATIAGADEPQSQQGWPLDPKDAREMGRSPAYNKAADQAIADPSKAGCYYSTSGCDKATLDKDNRLVDKDYPPKKFPQDGYVLGADGLYHFQPNSFGRQRN